MSLRTCRAELKPRKANYAPLTPIAFLSRSAAAFPNKVAVVDGSRRFTYREFEERCRRLASALIKFGIAEGETVAVLAPNVAAMIEAHYGIPMAGAVLNALNLRLDAAGMAFCLRHSETRLLLVDSEHRDVASEAIRLAGGDISMIVISERAVPISGAIDYENFLISGDPSDELDRVIDEWSAITLSYTSGTTGDPKGALSHHRGAYLNAVGNAFAAHLDAHSVYLWTLPMFHCNGWSHTWAVTAVGGTHICLRKINVNQIYELVDREKVTHMSAAPVVLSMLSSAAKSALERPVRVLTGGSPPPSTVISKMETIGFTVMHIYGMTESTGPSLICEWRDEWNDLPPKERLAMKARQGVRLVTMQDAKVVDTVTGKDVFSDGSHLGEIVLRGNTIMMGYFKNPEATETALAEGWLHTGDLAVQHADGTIEIKDRAKDIIISGGENISSVEIEEVLYRHPAVREAAVVARKDQKWGEHPCAFIDLEDEAHAVSVEELTAFCRANLAGFKIPRTYIFGSLPKNSTGKVLKNLLREKANAEAAADSKAS